MKILDWYILKKYLSTFITIQLLFIPIAIVVNLADNIDKILANEVPFNLVAEYYFNFTIYFSNSLLPLFLFLSVISSLLPSYRASKLNPAVLLKMDN